MDRRCFMLGFGSATAILSIGGCAQFSPMGCDTISCSQALSTQLTDLADPRFLEHGKGRSLQALYMGLMRKGVISTNLGVNVEKLSELARDEPLIVYQGFYYTQTELDLYALAYLSSNT